MVAVERRCATGWRLQIAVHDPMDGLGWAFSAADARTEGP
jgi:hypothetical protein